MSDLILIDGNSLINRAFYSMPPLSVNGVYTNAVYGFLNMLVKLINDLKPKYIATAFDLKDKTFRHELYSDYKANRKGMPDELASQLPILKEVLKSLNIKIFECSGFEADDILGTISKKYKNAKTSILTADRDMLQLVDENINILLTKKGISELMTVDEKTLLNEFGLKPEQVIEYKALLGDASDNIPGVMGIGEKTALNLIQRYDSLDNIYNNIESEQGKLKEKLIAGKESAYLSKKLAAIKIDCDICQNVDLEELRYDYPFSDKTYKLFEMYKFKSLLDRAELFKADIVVAKSYEKAQVVEVKDINSLNKLVDELFAKKKIAISFSNQKINLAYDKNTEYIIEISDTFLPDVLNISNVISALGGILKSDKVEKVVFDAKGILYFLKPFKGVLNGVCDDIGLMNYVLGGNNDNLNDLIFNENLHPETEAVSIFYLHEILQPKLKENDLQKLYEIEFKLYYILYKMETEGIKVDKNELNNLSNKYNDILKQLTSEIYKLSDEEFNINSTKQLAHILFDKLGLDSGKKTKTGLSTDIEVLENLSGSHEIIDKLIKYRQISKLYGTYIEGLKNVIDKNTYLVHTVFKQTLTATGRLSSVEPNLQNIPVRDEEGREIRKIFVARSSDRILVTADYSQIELRLLAHLSKDKKLLNAYNNGLDIHAITASEVFNTPIDKVDKHQRRAAKAVNFGIIYGISDFGLSRQLAIPVSVAKGYIKKYFETYSKVEEYMNSCIEFAQKNGFVKTMFNRIRYIRDINSKNYNLRSFSERVAMNMPLQGSAADILKIAMVNVYDSIEKQGLRSKLILTVHDELLVDAFKDEQKIVEAILKECMENAVKIDVPLTVNIEKGDSWYDAK